MGDSNHSPATHLRKPSNFRLTPQPGPSPGTRVGHWTAPTTLSSPIRITAPGSGRFPAHSRRAGAAFREPAIPFIQGPDRGPGPATHHTRRELLREPDSPTRRPGRVGLQKTGIPRRSGVPPDSRHRTRPGHPHPGEGGILSSEGLSPVFWLDLPPLLGSFPLPDPFPAPHPEPLPTGWNTQLPQRDSPCPGLRWKEGR